MYRLIGPKLILFIPIVVLGIFIVAFIPSRYGAERILSFTALLMGEAGLSFIPILALYPKATPIQAGLLAIIYFFITFIICFSAFGINGLGWPGNYAFALRDGNFVINTFALFAANIFSTLALILNFKLLYDEELTKNFISKQKSGYKVKQRFFPSEKPFLKQPVIGGPIKETSKQKKEEFKKSGMKSDSFEDEILKPFEFQPETENINPEILPEESSGKLFSPKEKETNKTSDFFAEEESNEQILFKDTLDRFEGERKTSVQQTKQSSSSPFPPSDIKDDLQAIFEQYSSLNAVKKLTSPKIEKQLLFQKRKSVEKPVADIPQVESKEEPASLKEEEIIFDATYRQITEEEKLAEIKEELKKQLKEELEAKLQEQIQVKEEEKTKEDLTQSIQTLKNELKKELEEKEEKIIQESQETKEDLIRSLKKELIESLKEELKKEIVVPEQRIQKEEPKPTREDLKKMSEILTTLNNTLKSTSSMFLDYSGNLLTRGETDKRVIQEDVCKAIAGLFSTINKNITSTNQGKLLHVLLESEEGTLVLAETKNKILTIGTAGTGEASSAQILRAISEIEEI